MPPERLRAGPLRGPRGAHAAAQVERADRAPDQLQVGAGRRQERWPDERQRAALVR